MSKIYAALEFARSKRIIPDRPVEAPLPKTYREPEVDFGVAEEMLTLYQNITMLLPDVSRPVVMFIGSHSNEGTSTVARQLAKTASLRLGKSVLLIDLDRSRPEFQVFVDVAPECDLEEVIKTDAPVERAYCQVEDSSLYVMPLFQQSSLNPRTLDSAKNTMFWETLRDRFDMIIMDTPPATLFPDGLAMVRQVDGVILVVEAEKTRWPVALSVKEKIIKNGGNLLGIVFNKRRFYIPEWLYKRL
jgi:Mrp family chromosome partitioning ATPase